MKKKILALLTMLCLGVSCVGCGNSEMNNTSEKTVKTEAKEENNQKVSDKLNAIQEKYNTDKLGVPKEIQNLEITILGKEFKTGQTFGEYYNLFSEKADELALELNTSDPDEELGAGHYVNANVQFGNSMAGGLTFTVINNTQKSQKLKDCSIMEVRVSIYYASNEYMNKAVNYPNDMFVLNGVTYKDFGNPDVIEEMFDTTEHFKHEEDSDLTQDTCIETSGNGELFQYLLYDNMRQNNEEFSTVDVLYGTNYCETEEALEDGTSQYINNKKAINIGVIVEDAYEKDNHYYAKIKVTDREGSVPEDDMYIRTEGDYISGYSVAKSIEGSDRTIRFNVTEDGYTLLAIESVVECPDTATKGNSKVTGLKNGDELTVIISELSYDSLAADSENVLYWYDITNLEFLNIGYYSKDYESFKKYAF